MRNQKNILLLVASLLIAGISVAQISIQSHANEGKVVNSRTEDLASFKEYMGMISSAANANSKEEVRILLDKTVIIAAAEVTRSKGNLQDLKDGKTDDLEKWQKKNKPEVPLNIKGEIHSLTSRIKHEEYLYKKLKTFDLSTLAESRSVSSLRGSLNSFKRDMEKNLKYDAEFRKKTPPPPPKGGTTAEYRDTNVKGDGFVLQSGSEKEIKSGDPRLEDYYASKKIRKDDFQSGQAMFKKYANEGDDMMTKKAFKMLYEVMSGELNANTWFLSMINSGGVKQGDIDVVKLSNTITKQTSLVEKAGKLKSSMSGDLGSNKSEISNLIDSFAATL